MQPAEGNKTLGSWSVVLRCAGACVHNAARAQNRARVCYELPVHDTAAVVVCCVPLFLPSTEYRFDDSDPKRQCASVDVSELDGDARGERPAWAGQRLMV
jgi:hypothetical protein